MAAPGRGPNAWLTQELARARAIERCVIWLFNVVFVVAVALILCIVVARSEIPEPVVARILQKYPLGSVLLSLADVGHHGFGIPCSIWQLARHGLYCVFDIAFTVCTPICGTSRFENNITMEFYNKLIRPVLVPTGLQFWHDCAYGRNCAYSRVPTVREWLASSLWS